jgi:3,4-dihydroxy-2-butanone 4-phosphate synthase
MNPSSIYMLTSLELAQRWGRSEAAICLATVVGVGPRFVKSDGLVLFPLEEIQRYERESAVLKPFKVLH